MQEKMIVVYPPTGFVDHIALMYVPLRDYIINIVPLMVEHIWQRKQTNEIPADKGLADTLWLCRLITLDKRVADSLKQYDIPGWPTVRDQLIEYINRCQNDEGVSVMKEKCMKLVLPLLEQRFKENYRFPVREYHCWWHTIHEDNSHMALHLINAYQPASPFDHIRDFVSTMLRSIEKAVQDYPSIRVVSCGSWLNGVSKFQQLWPESFKHNRKILNTHGGFGPGAWGQYLTTDGGFNGVKATILRRTGMHPLPLTECWSPVDEVVDHLKSYLQQFTDKP